MEPGYTSTGQAINWSLRRPGCKTPTNDGDLKVCGGWKIPPRGEFLKAVNLYVEDHYKEYDSGEAQEMPKPPDLTIFNKYPGKMWDACKKDPSSSQSALWAMRPGCYPGSIASDEEVE